MALKGLVLAHLNEKAEGAKVIGEAIKLNLKNANSWHFYALFHKEDKYLIYFILEIMLKP